MEIEADRDEPTPSKDAVKAGNGDADEPHEKPKGRLLPWEPAKPPEPTEAAPDRESPDEPRDST